jgi:hypothetical protein
LIVTERQDKPIEPLDPIWPRELSPESTDLMPSFALGFFQLLAPSATQTFFIR